MTTGRRRGLAITNTLLDVLLLSVVAHLYSPSVVWAVAPLAGALALGIHGAPRPRARGVRALAVLYATAAGWLVALAVAAIREIDAPGPVFFLLAALVMQFDHALVVAVSRRVGRRGVAIVGRGAGRKRLVEMVRADAGGLHEDPGARLRLSPGGSSADATEVIFDHGLPPEVVVMDGGVELWRAESCAEGLSGRVKRIYDVLLALVLLPVVALVTAVGALVVLLTSGRPVFHSHERLTLGERPFKIWKLRTMVPDAEPGGRPVWPRQGDTRATPAGSLLRRLWVDETPQIVNVLVGDLSWVGPRPERPPFAQVLSESLPRYRQRHRVRGGLTGLAQIEGYVGNTSLRRRTAHDLAYIERWTPWLDARIVLGTLCQLARRQHRPAIDYAPGHPGRVP